MSALLNSRRRRVLAVFLARQAHERLVDERAARSELYPPISRIEVSPLNHPRPQVSEPSGARSEPPEQAFEEHEFTG